MLADPASQALLATLPSFSQIRPDSVADTVAALLAENRARIDALLADPERAGWEETLIPIEDLQDRLNRAWSPIAHLHAVADSEPLRVAYNACMPMLAAYTTELGQNEALYHAYRKLADSADFAALSAAERQIVRHALRDFRLSGIELDAAGRARFMEIRKELSQLQTKFEENVLDATRGWNRPIATWESARLAGLPQSALDLARQAAARDGLAGWLFTLDYPSYMPVMTYADDRALREEMYTAYSTRASDRGPNAGEWDNSSVMMRILDLRTELARLIGLRSYAEYSLATKMAPGTADVIAFLRDLARRSRPVAETELAELRTFARARFGAADIAAYDFAYYSEKLRQDRYAIGQEELRPYFPAPRVISGMFQVVRRLYGLEINERSGIDTWHPDVRFFEIRDADGCTRGGFYLDLYARAHKRGGAWMDECIARRRSAHGVQLPVAYLSCNFTPPVGDRPSLLTHNEVTTLFHEFGHGLHHMLTLVDRPTVAGINGVAWDAVELPSQFLENWAWEREALDLVSGHVDSGIPISDELYQRMRAARNFQSGLQMLRQVEFALFDFRLHMEWLPEQGDRIQLLLDEVRDEVAVLKPPSSNRYQHSFSHIFAGGYAAGYYSYKWAEVLSADAYSLFEENGIFDAETGRRFLTTVLEQGGSREPMELFVEFRGRPPRIDALLAHSGLNP